MEKYLIVTETLEVKNYDWVLTNTQEEHVVLEDNEAAKEVK